MKRLFALLLVLVAVACDVGPTEPPLLQTALDTSQTKDTGSIAIILCVVGDPNPDPRCP